MLLLRLKMLVSTTNPVEKKQLEEEYLPQGTELKVPFGRSQFLCNKVRQVTYEYFHNNSEGITEQLQEMVVALLTGHFDLGKYHTVICELKKQQEISICL